MWKSWFLKTWTYIRIRKSWFKNRHWMKVHLELKSLNLMRHTWYVITKYVV